ncbi:MAG: hypothetical protein K6F09_02055 [Clostridiales bacterium]|nr:hypothetical protein [Clostridiales bacterium]
MYDSKLKNPETDRLFEAILALKDEEECYKFFDDICTVKEIHDIAQRLEVASLLKKGETVAVIALKTGTSTTTVSRVNRCLHYGSGGYNMILDRIGTDE